MGIIENTTRSDRGGAGLRAGLALLALAIAVSVGSEPASDAGALRVLLEARGFSVTQSQAAVGMIERANARALPASALTGRIREGLARGAEPSTILGVVSTRLTNLERADDMARRCAQQGIPVRDRDRSLVRLADSFSMGVTPGDVLSVLPAAGRGSRDLEGVSRAAEVMGRLRGKGFPPGDTREVVGAAMGAGWTRSQMDGLVDVFLEARRLGVGPEKSRQLLTEGIGAKKEPAGLVEVVKGSARSDAASDAGASPRSSGGGGSRPPGAGSPKVGKGAGGSRGGGSGPKSAGPKGPRPQPRPQPRPHR
jgi:hypothetical protein